MPVTIDVKVLPVVNFSMQQNDIPVFRSIVLTNDGDEMLSDLCVSLSFDPECATPWLCHVEKLRPHETFQIEPVKVLFSTTFFINQTESVKGVYHCVVKHADEVLAAVAGEFTLLTYDQWAGITIKPELLSAFVTPNHSGLVAILQRTADILGMWTGNPALDEYQQRDPDRVKKMMAALFHAVGELNITYSSTIANYEEMGQRIRPCDAVLKDRMANCLDMTVFYASCLEAMNLHPLLVLISGHAFVGAWLVQDTFPDSVNDDVSLLTKRAAPGINEVLLVEATAMCNGGDVDFDKACLQAEHNLVDAAEFHLFVDVRRSRADNVKPLPVRVASESGWTVAPEPDNAVLHHDKPTALSATDIIVQQDTAALGRQTLWERKLLDLSMHNTLLNTRLSKGSLQLIASQVNEVEDALSSGEEFAILPRPANWDNPLSASGINQAIDKNDPIVHWLAQERGHCRLHSYLDEDVLKLSLTRLYRASRLSLEENGANTLYLSLGMLRWFETATSTKPRYAPILLLPVEIIRRKGGTGYVIRSRDDDNAVLNITLLEMLRQFFEINIAIPDPLPCDANGLDVPLIFNIFRRAVMGMPRWDVEDMAMLGIFSFSKFVMWNDIHSNADKLARNAVVESLIDNKLSSKLASAGDDETMPLEERFVNDQIVLPISADSSQMMAISAVLQGKSFVLYGPPGTGKSQTITNIIANALYKGKRVLFVAEKMAALQVVQNRLEKIGLASFCLELHSNKAKKSAVLKQLEQTTMVARAQSRDDYAVEAGRLSELRKELSTYEATLHKVYPSGLSLYDCISHYAECDSGTPCVAFPDDTIAKIVPATMPDIDAAVEDYRTAAAVIGTVVDHPLLGVNLCVYNKDCQRDLETSLDAVSQLLPTLQERQSVVIELLGGDYDLWQQHDPAVTIDLVKVLAASQTLLPELLSVNDNDLLSHIKELALLGQDIATHKEQLLRTYNDSVLSLDAASLLTQWKQAAAQWFLPRALQQKKLLQLMQACAKDGVSPKKDDVEGLLSSLCDIKSRQAEFDAGVLRLPDGIGGLFASAPQWDVLLRACDDTVDFNKVLFAHSRDLDVVKGVKSRLAACLSSGVSLFRQLYGDRLKELLEVCGQVAAHKQQLIDSLDFDVRRRDIASYRSFGEVCASIRTAVDQLRDWCIYNKAKDGVAAYGYAALCEAVETGTMTPSAICDVYRKSLYKSCAEFIIAREELLGGFKEEMFETKIQRYKKCCQHLEELTQKEIVARLSASLPDFQREASQTSSVGILQRNIRNGGHGVSLRKLFDLVADLLPRMCPCMLMSPMSVAQYIDVDSKPFDLVIFDEASQMPTCEAVGAVARGTQLVVVGDPKQMPPTNFFASNTFDEDNADKEDLESILDDCLALSLPSMYLQWHYRSKNESLIAFSNVNYYENKLLTFPSPDDLSNKVTYQYVEGVYERGSTRQNKAEADAVVNEIKCRLSAHDDRSIGVVTFNTNQQSIIEDKLTEMLDANPDLESAANALSEPIFVKNLENVQGDERDVILFSVGFGPDKTGKIAFNFGPLNRDGGWRRLNVAVSRARYEMKVFSTLRASDIDLNRTSAEGVAGLKAFLDYAAKGREALRYNAAVSDSFKDGVVNAVAAVLRQRGYEVRTNVGCSAFRIDLGVVDANIASQYALGVIFDGYNYNNAKTTRDREIIQPGVLGVLGWRLCRVWSLTWWLSPEKVIDDLEAEIKAVFAGARVAVATPAPDDAAIATADESDDVRERIIDTKCDADALVAGNPYRQAYTKAQLEPLTLPPNAFDTKQGQDLLASRLAEVVRSEAPIYQSLLFRRVVSSIGMPRITPHLANILRGLAASLPQTVSRHEALYWNEDQSPQSYRCYRPVSDRDSLEIPPEEVATAAYYLLLSQGSLPVSDLAKVLAREFNFSRMGSNLQTAMDDGIQLALQRGRIAQSNSNYIPVM